jgi:hypothetical protein
LEEKYVDHNASITRLVESQREITAENDRLKTDHSVYCQLISHGMPEGLTGEDQCMWLWKCLQDKDSEIDRLRLRVVELGGQVVSQADKIEQMISRESRMNALPERGL